ncbi:MAG: hypothetical protein JO264_13665 [Acidisphaera sp.]|nr:hypothetical protein [Acidisphaera sp.]
MRAGIAVPNFGGNRIRPLIAIRALRALARSRGKDVAQGVIFLHATQGRSGQRGFCRLRASPAGQALLRERPAARDSLADRGRLAALPTGTLGRAYADFMTENKLDLRALADLEALGGERPMSPDERWFIDRATDLHDLWHVVIGYGTDELGELCVLASVMRRRAIPDAASWPSPGCSSWPGSFPAGRSAPPSSRRIAAAGTPPGSRMSSGNAASSTGSTGCARLCAWRRPACIIG